MNTTIIMKALKSYAHECPAEELDDVLQGISEASALMEKQLCTHGHAEEATLVDYCMLMDMLNSLLYDVYGKGIKKYADQYTLDFFIAQCKKAQPDMVTLTADMYEAIFCFLTDLWHDNEEAGENNADGSYKG